MAQPHVDTTGKKRLGWFAKNPGGKGRTTKAYRTECKNGGDGYLGPRHEAHHILPQTSIEESITDSKVDGGYIAGIKYLTDWDINNPKNLIGLPHVTAYMLAFQDDHKVKSIGAGSAPWVSAFNRFRNASRKAWQAAIKLSPPKNVPIHQPVSWGHADYNDDVRDSLTAMWKKLKVRRKKHELTAKEAAEDLKNLEKRWNKHLKGRGATNKQAWDRMLKGTADAHLPFCMNDVPSPL